MRRRGRRDWHRCCSSRASHAGTTHPDPGVDARLLGAERRDAALRPGSYRVRVLADTGHTADTADTRRATTRATTTDADPINAPGRAHTTTSTGASSATRVARPDLARDRERSWPGRRVSAGRPARFWRGNARPRS